MDRLIRAFPLLAGKREAFQAFVGEIRTRHEEASRFYTSYGIVRESWHLQETPAGDLIICCTDLGDAQAAIPQYAQSQTPFEIWFKRRVLDLSGVDANRQPEGPTAQPIYDWPSRR